MISEFYQASQGLGNTLRQVISGRKSNGSLNMAFVRDVVKEHSILEDSVLGDLAIKGAFFDAVETIEHSMSDTFDISVPENNTYIANGFVSHNSTGTMVNTSTGIEPFFAIKWSRQGRLGTHEEALELAETFARENDLSTYDELPDQFVSAMELTPYEHVDVQAAAQRWVDSSISKTVNCPNDWTREQVTDLYRYMYNAGCKGGTIYRDGSRFEQVLTVVTEEKAPVENVESTHLQSDNPDMIYVDKKIHEETIQRLSDMLEMTGSTHIKRPKRAPRLPGYTMRGESPFGTVFVTISEDPNSVPYEVFVSIGKSGTDLKAQGESIGRMMSVSMQALPEHKRLSMLKLLVEQNLGIGGGRQSGFGAKRVYSVPDAIAQVIQNEYLEQKEIVDNAQQYLEDLSIVNAVIDDMTIDVKTTDISGLSISDTQELTTSFSMAGANMCPECGQQSFVREDGCTKCYGCGYAEC